MSDKYTYITSGCQAHRGQFDGLRPIALLRYEANALHRRCPLGSSRRRPCAAHWPDAPNAITRAFDPNFSREKRLLDWPTVSLPDGVYYLRLTVRDGGGTERVSALQMVKTDNTAPPTPVISLQLLTPEGELRPLKCSNVKKGSGKILITVQAFDPNFSSLTVNAEGNSSLSVPVIAQPYPALTAAVPLDKTYNGDIADEGYPTPTSFLWDPWSDPRIVPCCYIVRIDINDRALSSNVWNGGHHNAGWEAIGISF